MWLLGRDEGNEVVLGGDRYNGGCSDSVGGGKMMRCKFDYEGICNLTGKKCVMPELCESYEEDEYVPREREEA